MNKISLHIEWLRSTNILVSSPTSGRRLSAALVALMLILSGSLGFSAEGTNIAPAVTKLSRTVGLDIINRIVNPDKTVSLTFKWSVKGNPMTRTVVVNDDTIVVYNGKLKKLSDMAEADFHAKAVATVGADGVTTVLLRFGKSPLPKDQLTPAQTALLATLAPPVTAASEAALNKRVAALVDSLALTDPAKQERVRAVIAADLRAVRDAHNAGLQLDPSVHKNLLAGLQADLSPDQVESVKDKLTLNKLPLTFKVYHQILPGLKPEDDRVIMDKLQRAREECLDVKNADEMAPIFKHHKTEIETYLNSHGYEWDKSYKAFVEVQKAKSAKVADYSVSAPK